ncbi:hypothetical protein [Acholeplasma granularum]|uniref:hypothetical protein n=1 Tax=Acholeplasma granularum TaxID=264635 RepID=UPI0004AF3C20|nr:hypothetical protein [Acholeplasma granularum]
MENELIYNEYAGWKLDNHELLMNLKNLDSLIIFRFENVLNVIDFLYDKLIDDPTYNEDDHDNFTFGFNYVHGQVEEIKKILNDYYGGDYLALNLDAKKVNLLLNTIDFQHELLDLDNFDPKSMELLLNFEAEIIDKLSKKEPLEEKMYSKLDELSLKIFKNLNIDYYPIDSIYLEIADELGLLKE